MHTIRSTHCDQPSQLPMTDSKISQAPLVEPMGWLWCCRAHYPTALEKIGELGGDNAKIAGSLALGLNSLGKKDLDC